MRRMSLRNRLRVSIISLVTLMVTIQFLATLRVTADADFQNTLERSQAIASQVRSLVLNRLNQESARAAPPPSTLAGHVALWTAFLEGDPSAPDLLAKLMASSSVAVEVQVCDQVGRILVSSSPSRHRMSYRSVPDFEEWNRRNLWDRLFEILTSRKEYSTVIPLGVPEQRDQPIFTVHVFVSSVLLRNALMPQIRNLLATSALSLLAAILLAVLFSNMVLRAVDRLAKRIDQLTAGDFAGATAPSAAESAEIAAVSSKLNLLSEQFRDAMQLRGNIDHLLRSIEAAVMMFDPDGRLILAGQQAEALLGRSRDAMIGSPMEGIFPPDTALGEAILKAVDQGRPFRERPALLERGGLPPVRLLVSVELLENLPGVHQLGTLVTLRDVESRRRLRSQIDVSTRLAAINRLTGGVAHEIKNPLNAIALHLEVLKAKLSEPSTVGPEMKVIEREISRLDRVVKTFLDFTRPVELRLTLVDLVELTREVEALVLPEARRNGVSIEFETSLAEAPVQADRDLVEQAVLNIVMNGIEAMGSVQARPPGQEAGETETLPVPEPRPAGSGGCLRIGLERVEDDYQLSVIDEGGGVPPEIRDRIFNLYFTTKAGGSGIGLAMAFRIAHLHNGTIDFTTEVGRGTTFRLRLPASEETPAPVRSGVPEPAVVRAG